MKSLKLREFVITKQLSFIVATLVVAVAVAGLLIFSDRLPGPAKGGQVKGATADQKQQVFESCLANQLEPEAYVRYKNGDQSAITGSSDQVAICYSILAQP